MLPLYLILAFSIYYSEGRLYDKCTTNKNCDVTDSYCGKNNLCLCVDKFNSLQGSCVQDVVPKTGCSFNTTCGNGFPNSICSNSTCVCTPQYHFSKSSCIKNIGLDETCQVNEQCYLGQDMLKKVSCINKKCSCNAGLHQIGKKCSGAESAVLMTSLLLPLALLMVLFK